jgi:hypothetical protein
MGIGVTEAPKKAAGRPRKYAGKRPTWTIRLEEQYGERIRSLAESTGRSISEVCEQQIVNSFRSEKMLDNLDAKVKELTQELSDSRIYGREARTRMDHFEEQNRVLSQLLADSHQRLARMDDLLLLLTKTDKPREQRERSHHTAFNRPVGRPSGGRRFWKAQARLAQIRRNKSPAN